MRILLFLLGLSFITKASFAKIEAVLGNVPLKENKNLVALPSVASSEVIISRDEYVISYNKKTRSPNWVAWKIEKKNLGSAPRSEDFLVDSDLQEYLSQDPNTSPAVTPEDYRGSCYDRGHQAPSADRTSSARSNQATFVMSNMLPQTPYLNRYLWEQLERYTRQLVTQGKIVYVIAGPIYDEDFGAIGPNHDIPVPSKLFKMILVQDKNGTKGFAVVMPNILQNGKEPTDRSSLCRDTGSPVKTLTNEWRQYHVKVEEIQKLAGMKFEPL